MSFLICLFLGILFAGLAVFGWLAGRAVGMEQVTWKRALGFAVCETLAGYAGLRLLPVDVFVLQALVALLAALLLSPLFFRVFMTTVRARAVLGSLLLVCAGTAVAVVALAV